MPLHFFDFADGELTSCDQLGTNLPDVETAAREAVSALANISKDVRRHYKDRVLALKVRDQSGGTVLNVSLTLAVTWFARSGVELDEFGSAAPAQIPDLITLPKRDLSAACQVGGDA
jgi:hypothetical protein